MPRGDGSGPEGRGPQTGRGLVYCSDYNSPGFTKRTGRGGAGYGRGRGFRSGRIPARRVPVNRELQTSQTDQDSLKSSLESLEKKIDSLKDRIGKLED